MKKKILMALVMGSPLFLSAQTPGAAFLSENASVRAGALGDISVAARGAQALGANPAQVPPPHERHELYTSFIQPWGDSTEGQVAFASALTARQSWGLSALFSNSGKTTPRNAVGQPTGGNTATHHEKITGAYSLELRKGIRWGVAGNAFQSTLAGEKSGETWSADTGIILSTKKWLFSATLNHLGPGIKYLDQRDPLPRVIELDTSWEPGPVSILAGYQKSLVGSGSRGALGCEYRFRGLALRTGLELFQTGSEDLALNNQSTANELIDNLTMGFGLHLGQRLHLDYAIRQNSSDWGPAHSAALTWTWGNLPRAPQPQKNLSKKKKPSPKKTSPPQKRRIKLKLGK